MSKGADDENGFMQYGRNNEECERVQHTLTLPGSPAKAGMGSFGGGGAGSGAGFGAGAGASATTTLTGAGATSPSVSQGAKTSRTGRGGGATTSSSTISGVVTAFTRGALSCRARSVRDFGKNNKRFEDIANFHSYGEAKLREKPLPRRQPLRLQQQPPSRPP